jgi:integrase
MRGHVRKRGSAWQVIVSAGADPITGRRRQVTRFVHGTKREAEGELARLLVRVGQGSAPATNVTVDELLTRWLENVGPDWSPSTLAVTTTYVDLYLRPSLGKVQLRKLTPAKIDAFYAAMRDRGGRKGASLSPRTVRRIHNIVHSSLQQAVRWGWVTTNPASNASPPRTIKTDPKPPAPDEVARLLEECERTDPSFTMFVRLAAATGARRGELVGLRWSAVDFDACSLLIARSVVNGTATVVEKDTKTHQARRIALDEGTVAALTTHRLRCAEAALACGTPLAADAYVFSSDPVGLAPWHPNSATQHFRRLRQRVGLEHVRLHDLRHYVATRLIAAGVPVRTVSGRLGHSNTATTLNVYSHFVEATDQDAAALLGALLDGTEARPPGLTG